MNIMYSGNKKIVMGILISILSIVKYNKDAINFYILSMDLSNIKSDYQIITKQQIKLLNELVQKTNPQSKVFLKDITKVFVEELQDNKNMNNFYTPYCLLRLLADKVDLPNKMLYLDADTVANKNIKELYDINIENYELAAARDYMGKIFKHPNYINSGVMLLNLEKIKETKLLEKTRIYINEKKKSFPDQDALNKLVTNKKIISSKYNAQRKMKSDTVIKHFCKGIKFFPIFKIFNIKPWEINKVHTVLKINQFDDIFEVYSSIIKLYN